jgi:phosphate transport system permease protein
MGFLQRLPSSRFKEVRFSDLLFFNGLRLLALMIIALFAGIVYFLYVNSHEALAALGTSFFTTSEWSPTQNHFGVLAFIYGTLVTSFLAVLISVPISLGAALFLVETGPHFLRRPVQTLIELLAAIPSVVYGLWAIFVLAPFIRTYVQPALATITPGLPFFQGPPYGLGLFTAGLVLAIMITPTITSITVEVFKSIPNLYREGALALGATSWEAMVLSLIRPGATGIFSGVILGLGRAMGETMAVTMVIGNRAEISSSLFSPGATMSSVIANEYAEANLGLHLSSLTAVGLTLLVVSLIVNSIARMIIWQYKRKS